MIKKDITSCQASSNISFVKIWNVEKIQSHEIHALDACLCTVLPSNVQIVIDSPARPSITMIFNTVNMNIVCCFLKSFLALTPAGEGNITCFFFDRTRPAGGQGTSPQHMPWTVKVSLFLSPPDTGRFFHMKKEILLLLIPVAALWLLSKASFYLRRSKRRKYYREVYLKSDDWQRKRYVVLKRDNWTCTYCGSRATQVHHKRYARKNIGREPIHWLVSVCEACHQKLHQ